MLEQLYPVRLIEKKIIYALVLGITYSIIGIGIAVLLFPEDPAIVAVAMISLMFYPTLKKLMQSEETEESKNTKFSLRDFFHDHKYIFKVYLLFFMGVLLVFAFFALYLPSIAANHIFNNQLNVLYKTTGNAIFNVPLFNSIFSNNLSVLILVFVTAFFIGEGGLFLITWNASVWGTIFALFAKNYATETSNNPLYAFLVVLTIVIAHTMLEAFAYISSANAGSIISGGLIKEKFMSKKFKRVLKGTIITLLFAMIVIIVAVSVETYVLSNVTIYQEIVRHTFI